MILKLEFVGLVACREDWPLLLWILLRREAQRNGEDNRGSKSIVVSLPCRRASTSASSPAKTIKSMIDHS